MYSLSGGLSTHPDCQSNYAIRVHSLIMRSEPHGPLPPTHALAHVALLQLSLFYTYDGTFLTCAIVGGITSHTPETRHFSKHDYESVSLCYEFVEVRYFDQGGYCRLSPDAIPSTNTYSRPNIGYEHNTNTYIDTYIRDQYIHYIHTRLSTSRAPCW